MNGLFQPRHHAAGLPQTSSITPAASEHQDSWRLCLTGWNRFPGVPVQVPHPREQEQARQLSASLTLDRMLTSRLQN